MPQVDLFFLKKEFHLHSSGRENIKKKKSVLESALNKKKVYYYKAPNGRLVQVGGTHRPPLSIVIALILDFSVLI